MNVPSLPRDTLCLVLLALVLAAACGTAWLFHGFTAEDSYILYRYVENLHRDGTLAYNAGERINALTSPLHALVLWAASALTGEVPVTNKVLGALLFAGSAAAASARFRADPPRLTLLLALVALPGAMPLWAFGGLETPLLMALVTGCSLVHLAGAASGRSHVYAILLLAGLGFLARHDAALFFGPLALAALLRERAWGHRVGAAVLGALAPLAWLGFARVCYGDVLPTSYYLKTPTFTPGDALRNAEYIVTWLLLTGLLPVFLLSLRRSREPAAQAPFDWALSLAVTLELAYGLTMATTHMMFSFRAFVPYVPAAALLVAMRLLPTPGRRRVLLAFVAALIVMQPAHSAYIDARSLNGLARVGEFRHIGARAFVDDFLAVLREQAEAIRAHSRTHPGRDARPPRISTYVGGLVPYLLPEAYIYEPLAYYRHGEPRYRNFSRHADYIMALHPFFGPLDGQLPGGIERYELLHERALVFDGNVQSFRLYYNPQPLPHELGDRIDRRTR